jgi:phage-related protein
MATFPLPIKSEMTDSLVMTVKTAQFGAGARQLKSGGLEPIQRWNVEVPIKKQVDRIALETFLDSVGQSKVFQWRSPLDAGLEDYRVDGAVSFRKWNGGGKEPVYYVAQLTFRRVYAVI